MIYGDHDVLPNQALQLTGMLWDSSDITDSLRSDELDVVEARS